MGFSQLQGEQIAGKALGGSFCTLLFTPSSLHPLLHSALWHQLFTHVFILGAVFECLLYSSAEDIEMNKMPFLALGSPASETIKVSVAKALIGAR